MNNKHDFINGIASKLVNNEQLTTIETQAVISALRESNNCLQKPYYEVIYHDEYDNTEHRIIEPLHSIIVDTIGDCKIQEDCFDLKFRRIVKKEMIFNQTNYKDLRDLFCNAVTNVFGDSTTFLDFLENEEYSIAKYDCYINCNGENYIINRETGEYINWYKFDHIGRDIHISTNGFYKNIPKWIEKFLVEFKESEE